MPVENRRGNALLPCVPDWIYVGVCVAETIVMRVVNEMLTALTSGEPGLPERRAWYLPFVEMSTLFAPNIQNCKRGRFPAMRPPVLCEVFSHVAS